MRGDADGVDQLDYAVVADPVSLEQPAKVAESAVALVAARVGTTRLIDNLLLVNS